MTQHLTANHALNACTPVWSTHDPQHLLRGQRFGAQWMPAPRVMQHNKTDPANGRITTKICELCGAPIYTLTTTCYIPAGTPIHIGPWTHSADQRASIIVQFDGSCLKARTSAAAGGAGIVAYVIDHNFAVTQIQRLAIPLPYAQDAAEAEAVAGARAAELSIELM